MKKLFLLGSTGSIGQSTLDVVNQHPDQFTVNVLVANRNIDLLAKQIKEYQPQYAVIYDHHAYKSFNDKYSFDSTIVSANDFVLR